jgi:hypothetical protein
MIPGIVGKTANDPRNKAMYGKVAREGKVEDSIYPDLFS